MEMGEIAYMAAKRKDAVDYMLGHPAHEAELMAGRFVMFWSGGSLHPLSDLMRNASWWFRFVLVFNLLVAGATLAGMILLFERRSLFAFPLAAGPILFPFAYYVTLALPRYRHPIDPVMILLTAITIRMASHRRARQRATGMRQFA